MQHHVMKDLHGDGIVARDGPIGSVRDAYFDDEAWALRYLVVDTGGWLPGRLVLISPASISDVGPRDVRVNLTRKQVERAPGAEEHRPVSRLYEEAHALHYGYPYYWAGPYLWGQGVLPTAAPPAEHARASARARDNRKFAQRTERAAAESHLRSIAEVVGYRIHAADGEIGHVEDFVFDDRDWAIADMVVDTRNWLPGNNVLVSPTAIENVDWKNREVRVRLTREEVRHSTAA